MKRFLLMISLLPGVLQAETLSLDSCISMALENNKTVQSSQLQAEKYQHEVKAYWANFFPNFKLIATDAWSNAEGYMGGEMLGGLVNGINQFMDGMIQLGHYTGANPTYTAYQQGAVGQFKEGMQEYAKGIKYDVNNIFQAGVSLEQPLYMGGKVITAYRMAKLGRSMAAEGARLSQNEVIVKVQEAYALAVRANEMHKVAVRYDSLLNSLLIDVTNAEKRGVRSRNDVLKVQVKLSEAELQVRQAENGQRLSQMNLCHYIGLPLTTRIEVNTDAFSRTPDRMLDPNAGVTSRPEYSVLDMKAELAARKVQLARSEFLPQVVLGATYSYMNGFEVAGEKMLDGGTAAVLLNVKIPLYHANEGIHKVKSARLEAERARLEQEELVEKMNLELAQAANNLDEAFLEVDLAEKSLAQSEDNLRCSRSCYNAGTESLSDLLEAQTLWQQAYAKLANARATLFVAATKYRKAAGLDLK